MSNLVYDPQESLGFMTVTAGRLLGSFLRKKMREAGIDLTAEQWGVLVSLWNKEAATQEELARASCLDKSSMSRVLTVMEGKGLIVRRVDPANARRKLIRASDAAMAFRERGLGVAREALALALADVGPEQRAVCLAVLATVKRTLQPTA